MVGGLINRFTVISEWIYFLFVVQLCWLLGVIIGLGVVGLIPSTYAAFAVMRKRLQGEEEQSVSKFWFHYRAYLFHQSFGFIWLLIGCILYYDVRLLFSYPHTLTVVVGALFISLLILYVLCSMVLIPVSTHYDLKWTNRIRLALMILVTQPHISLGLCVGTFGLYLLLLYFPIVYFLFGISLAVCIYTKLSLLAFKTIEKENFVRISPL